MSLYVYAGILGVFFGRVHRYTTKHPATSRVCYVACRARLVHDDFHAAGEYEYGM